nr:conserved hypothetical protein [Hymenolepis microstoma]
MFEFALMDENNRKLEAILSMIKCRDWDAALLNQNLPLNAFRIRDLSKEPEHLHVLQLHRLYYGLSHFATWFERGMSDDFTSLSYGGAVSMIEDVASLINAGDIVDIFLRPYIFFLSTTNSVVTALELLETYAVKRSYHPNVYRYLAEGYLLSAANSGTAIPRTSIDFRDAINNDLIGSPNLQTTIDNLVKYSLRLLPTVAPSKWDRGDKNWHYMIANICLENGFHEEALEIAFSMLDNPSWCHYDRVWKLLDRCLFVVGFDSSSITNLWLSRISNWNRYIFTNPNLSPDAKDVLLKLNRISIPCAHIEILSEDSDCDL